MVAVWWVPGVGTPYVMGDTYVPRFWPPFFTLAGSSTIFLGHFFSSTNTKTIFWGIKTSNSYRIRSFRSQISFFPRSFWVQVSAASGTPPSVFGPSTPPRGWVRADPRLAPSERETSLQSNAPSHWLGANLESTLVSICVKSQNQGSVHSGWRLGSVLLTGPWLSWFQQACLSTGPWMTWFQQACFVFNTGEFRQVPDFWNGEYTSSTTPGDLSPWPCNGP